MGRDGGVRNGAQPLLDRTHSDSGMNARDTALPDGATDAPEVHRWQTPLGWLRRAGQFLFALSFSSLTRRIVSLHIAGPLGGPPGGWLRGAALSLFAFPSPTLPRRIVSLNIAGLLALVASILYLS